MVVIFLPATAETGVMHARVGAPSTCTVHAPHSAMPQPNFVPVMPSTSRSVHSSGVSCGTSAFTLLPLIFNAGVGASRYSGGGIPGHRPHDWRPGQIAHGGRAARRGLAGTVCPLPV